MIKQGTVFAVAFMVASAACIPGCKGGDGTGKTGPKTGTLASAAAPGAFVYTESQRDPFNAKNGIESTRKNRPTAFGGFTGELPEATPDMNALGVIVNPPGLPKFGVTEFENYHFRRSSFPFDYENDIAALKSLAALHPLKNFSGKKTDELADLQTICEYTRRFLEGGNMPKPDDAIGPSAFLITKNRREKGIGGGSDIHAAFMCQLALAAGYTARMVGSHCFDADGRPLLHDVCEVYLTLPDKWAVFDPYNRAACYFRDNVPLSALELHTLAAENRLHEVSPVCMTGDVLEIAPFQKDVLPRFRYVYIWRMNDILGKSPRNGSIPWSDLYRTHLVWEDPLTPVASGGWDKIERFAGTGVRYVTHTRTDFEWNLGGVNVTVERRGETGARLFFDTIMPNFVRFDLYIAERPMKTGSMLTLDDAAVRISVAAENAFGKRGLYSLIELAQ